MNQRDKVTFLDATYDLNEWMVEIFTVVWNVETEGINTKLIEYCHGPHAEWYRMFVLAMRGQL